jgi:hypothetical protein
MLSCPALLGYYGPPWTQSFNTPLAAGQYRSGALCSGFGNGTVTQSVQVISS